ncbi:MAG: tRNA lysidine(34) synthetase TilS [Gammaproteobacteria bacterium]
MTEFNPEVLWDSLGSQDGDPGRQRYCVAYSGGLDSTVLLVALASLADRLPPGSLRAAHVHHGLHPDADAWAEQCQTRCRALEVPIRVLRVDARPRRGESPEAKAREMRYAALGGDLAPGEVLLTAHHADDQLETVLIQLLRGAGVAGLAAMPPRARLGPGWHQRPLLGVPREALRAWARAQGIGGWIEDPANAEPRFARNHLRREVLPAIRAHWPAAAAAVARSARHCAEAAELLDEFAAHDATHCADGVALCISAMRSLDSARRRNLVRWQARRLGLPTPDERRLATLLTQTFEAAGDAQPEVRWPGVVALRYADRLWLIPAEQLEPPPGPIDWPDPRVPLDLGRGLGRLSLAPTTTGGLRPEALEARPWRIVGRRGGERLNLPGRTGSRALKKLLNEAGVPPWLRLRIPVLEIAGTLAAVGDLWVDETWWAPSGGAAWRLSWTDCTLPGRKEFIVGEQAF